VHGCAVLSASHCTPNLNLTAADKRPVQHCRVTHVVFRWATERALSTTAHDAAPRLVGRIRPYRAE
jgi:hypothetical protein